MFINEFKYFIITVFRDKRFLFWLLTFPIILGTFFKVAFSSIYEKEIEFSAIPTAIVIEKEDSIFEDVIETVSTGDNALIEAKYVDEEEALHLLGKDEVYGIIYGGDKVRLSVAHSGISQTILKAFTDRYLVQEKLIKDAVMNDPEKLPAITAELTKDISVLKEDRMAAGNSDVYVTYYFNLIAMVAVCCSVTGLSAATNNQADMSKIGARKSCSSTPKLTSTLAVLSGCWLISMVCMTVCVSFIAFILKIDLGSSLALVYLSALTAGIMGTSMGFTIGSVVKGSYEKKNSAAMIVSLGGNFLSGLMVADIKPIIMDKAPIVNFLNPAAIICDSFYYLNIDTGYDRFIGKIVMMLIYTAVFTAIGFIFTRRKKYASL